MDWTEIIAEVAAKDVERAENIAVMTVPYGIYIEDYSSLEEEVLEIAKIDLIDEELLAKNRETARIHIYISPEDNPAEATAFLEDVFVQKISTLRFLRISAMLRLVLIIGRSISIR